MGRSHVRRLPPGRRGRRRVGCHRHVSLEELALTEEERRQLHILQRLIDRLHSRWDSICGVCGNAPRTLVHGDLSGKNLRLCKTDAGPQIVALDWETAGWGLPAADLP